jgi:superfamily II DNA helicase RecQ
MDIPDIKHVVQFVVPSSLSVLNQHAGHAGHSGQHALAIVLVEPAVFQTVKKRRNPKVKRKQRPRRATLSHICHA